MKLRTTRQRIAAILSLLILMLSAGARAQDVVPELPRWTYRDEVSFYKSLTGECHDYYRDSPGYIGQRIAMRTCYGEYQKLWPVIEGKTAISDRWLLFQWIGDSGNSGGAGIRLIYRERGKRDWAYLDLGEGGKKPAFTEPRPIAPDVAEPFFASIDKTFRVDHPAILAPHASAAYFTIYDGERVYRKAYIPNALSIFSQEELEKLKTLTNVIFRLGTMPSD